MKYTKLIYPFVISQTIGKNPPSSFPRHSFLPDCLHTRGGSQFPTYTPFNSTTQENINFDNVIQITPKEAKHMRFHLSKIKHDPKAGKAYLKNLKFITSKAFPKHVLKAFENQANGVSHPYIILLGLPYDNISGIPAPNELGNAYKKTDLSENIIMALGLLQGNPYSIHIGKQGKHIVNNLVPYKQDAYKATGTGIANFGMHIENAFGKHAVPPCSPDFILLSGLYDNLTQSPETILCDLQQALQYLSQEEIAELKKPQFNIKVPIRWQTTFPKPLENVWVISPNDSHFDCAFAFYEDMISANTPQGTAALQALKKATDQSLFRIVTSPGVLICMDNRKVAHGRTAFQDHFDKDGKGSRWLLRLFVTKHIDNFKKIFGDAETPIFSPDRLNFR